MIRMWIIFLAIGVHAGHAATPGTPDAAVKERSLQQVIDAQPGQPIFVPAGDYVIDAPLRITADQTGLWGPGRILQQDPSQNILEVLGADNVRIQGLTLTRAPGQEESTAHAIFARGCRGLSIEGVQVLENRSQAGTIYLDACEASVVRDCLVRNYKRVGVDDRTGSELYGYAFRVIDGTGIQVQRSTGIQVLNNRVLEDRLFPDEVTKQRFELGTLTEGQQPLNKGRLAPAGDYANNWHQGSAITVTSPRETSHILISGNYIENAAQGIDLHTDNTVCSNNIIRYAFIGIKCMHGAKNVIISDNIVSHNDLWGLVMLPGTSSHPARPAEGDAPARKANFTRGNIIANNIFSDYGFGYEYYNWDRQRAGVISLESGQLPENPLMTDVIIEGNIVYDTAREQVLVEDVPRDAAPRYDWAVFITPDPRPQGLLFRNNIFHPGREGVSNIPLEAE